MLIGRRIVKQVILISCIVLCGMTIVHAKVPLAFIAVPTINDMAIGQTQTLRFIIQNQSTKQTLPLRDINIKNIDDQYANSTISMHKTCGSSLAPLATCTITINVQGLTAGMVNRLLYIDYNGRAPLTSLINLRIALAHYTMLVYIVGTDLESRENSNYATKNIEQMMMVGSTKNLNVVLETGGANKDGWRTVQRKLVLPGQISFIKDLGNISMGDSETIQDFLEWGMTNFPAEKYIVIFWDHGGGPNGGYGGSEVSPAPTATPINQLAAIMQAIYTNTGHTFEIIGFDACFLGNTETFAGLYPYANYLIGSEDMEPGMGWQYNTLLNYINQNPSSNGLDIGIHIVDGYTEQNEGESTTLSVIESAGMPHLLTTIDEFSALLRDRLSTSIQPVEIWKNIAKSRFRAPDYGTSVWDNSSYDVVDLLEFAQSVQYWFSADAPVVLAATSVINAIQQTVSYYRNSPNRQASYGLTTYYPSIMGQYESSYPQTTQLNGVEFFSSNYISLVNEYHTFYSNNIADLTASLSNLAYNAGDYTVDIDNDYDEVYAAVGNDTCTILDDNGNPVSAPCVSTVQNPDSNGEPGPILFNKAANASNWPLINNTPVLLIPNDTNPNLPDEDTFLVPAKLLRLGGGYIIVVKNGTEYEVVGFQSTSGSANTQGKLFDIYDGDEFIIRAYADYNGWNLRDTNVEITAPLTITFGSLSSNFNVFRFLVGDLTGKLTITSGLAY